MGAVLLIAAAMVAGCGVGVTPPSVTVPGTGSAAPSADQGPAKPVPLQRVPITIAPELIGADDPFGGQQFAEVPQGWSISVFARLNGARFPAWAPDGALLVSSPKEGSVVRFTADGPGGTARQSVLLPNLKQPLGLAFAGDVLYVAESNAIRAYDYAGGKATNPRTIADDLPDAKSGDLGGTYAHALKNLVIGQDGSFYYSVGSTTNISVEDRDANPERAVIMRIPPGGGKAEVYARGVRNGTGLAVAPDGAVWTAVNHRDNILYPFDKPFGSAASSSRGQVVEEYVRDHPAEQLAKLTPGRDLGWPYCNSDPDVEPGEAGTAFDFTTPAFTPDVEFNADGKKFDCAALPVSEQSMPAHSAPLGMDFGTLPAPFGEGAVVGLHGSWNATPPRAPEVSFFPYANGNLGPQQTIVGGFQNADGSRWGGRPVAAAVGPDKILYVFDDTANAIYRVTPP
ncbi:PQQ-dependent sugar dehydrogenase [Pseudonocardia sp. TRM90224]|uniref:PQQ-dependent sugar dehydrogenase n=1 Tax=Pseudonocardia sp. TRM90224 TaxID=2812678 RepID=UPI001E3EA4A5|nr:gluconolaconase [Pseudonocardia sp. TRM90224]